MTFFRSSHYPVILFLGAGLTVSPALAQTSGGAPAAQAQTTAPAAAENGQVVEDIVARVNDQIITQSDYDREAQRLDAEATQQGLSPAEVEAHKKDLLRDLIDQQLLLSKGKDLGITGETELIQRLDEIRKQNHLDSMEDLEKAAQAQGVSYEDFKANIRDGIITQQVVQQEVGRHLNINEVEMRNYYKAHESEFSQPESVTLQEILIATPADADASQVAAAESKANGVETQLKGGANFGDLAKSVSSGPTAADGGGLGVFVRGGGKLAKPLEDATFSLKAGQYTAPIQTKQGFVIFLVNQHTEGGDAGFAKAEPEVAQTLYMQRMEPALRDYLKTLREGASIDIKQGYTDSGASANEIQITNTAYVPPGPKHKKKFTRTRLRGRTRKAPPLQTASAAAATTSAAAAKTSATASQSAAKSTKQVASSQKPGKPEKIRFGQAPRESLPAPSADSGGAQTASTTSPTSGSVTAPGETIGGQAPAEAKAEKTRFSDRAKIRKVKQPKNAADPDTPPAASADELATQKVQDAPLGLADQTAKKKEKGPKTRYSAKQKAPQPAQQPYPGPTVPQQNPPATPPSATPPAAGSPPSSAAPGGSPQ